MEVNGSLPVQGASPLKQVQPTAEPLGPSSSMTPQDDVVISPAAKLMDELSQTSEIRAERLEQIKAAIDAGDYETPEKLEIALERLLQEIRVAE